MTLLAFVREHRTFLGAGALLTFGSSFGQTFFISLFAGQIREDFGLSHGAWGTLYALGTLCSAALMMRVGALTDRFRVRSLSLIVMLALSAACGFMAFNTSWVGLVVVIFALRFCGQGMMGHLAVVAMAHWFVSTRGRALACAGLGFSLAEMSLPALIVWLLNTWTWRSIWIGCALFVLLLTPLVVRLLQQERTPQAIASAQAEQGAGLLQQHWRRAQVLRHPLFWLMLPTLIGLPAFNTAFFFHQVEFAQVKGLSHLQLVALFPLYSLVSVMAMLLSGLALDRFGATRLLQFYLWPASFGFVLFGLPEIHADAVMVQLGVSLVLLALTQGSNSTLVAAFWAECYGTRYLGEIKALGAALMVLGSALGPAITGVLLSLNFGLTLQWLAIGGYFVLASLALVAVSAQAGMNRPRRPK